MPTPIPALQNFQAPNIAGTYIGLENLNEQKRNNTINRAVSMGNLRLQQRIADNAALTARRNEIAKKAALIRKQRIEKNDFALNLLAGVNSSEDLDIAKRQFLSRYPEDRETVESLMPYYDPKTVRMIHESIRTETQRMKQRELDAEANKVVGFSAGSAIYKGGKKIGQVPPTPPKEQWEVFQDSGGNQVYIKKGSPIPRGYSLVQKKGTNVTVNTGNVSKTTKTALEKSIIQGVQSIKSFQNTRKLFKPEYLTLFGKGKKTLAESADKLGMSTEDQKALIRDRSAWFRQAKADFIAYRKWATGVAGGEKEMAEIATSFPDPVNNSPTQYQSNLDNIEETTKRVLALNKEFLRSGIDLNQPLDKVLEQARSVGIPTSTPASTSGGNSVTIQYDAQGNRVGG